MPILWVDYLQIMPSPEGFHAEERMAIKAVVSGLRSIANTYDIPVFAISSVNRASYDKVTSLSALGGSSHIEYGVDSVICLGFDAGAASCAKAMSEPIRSLRLTTLKNRYAPISTSDVQFDCAHATFTTAA